MKRETTGNRNEKYKNRRVRRKKRGGEVEEGRVELEGTRRKKRTNGRRVSSIMRQGSETVP